MKQNYKKCIKVLLTLMCFFALICNSTSLVQAKKENGKSSQKNNDATLLVEEQLQDVVVETYYGKKWIQSKDKTIRINANKNELSVGSFRITNPNDCDVEYFITVEESNANKISSNTDSWIYIDEDGNESSEGIKGVLGANETSTVLAVKTNSSSKTKKAVKEVRLMAKLTEVKAAPHFAINTDVDLEMDLEGETVVLNDHEQNYLASVSGQKVTFSNATITGNTYAFSFGIYRGPAYATYNNEVNNVNFVDLAVTNGVLNGSDKVSSAVYAYGNSVFNNCNMTGTTSTAEGYNVYDIGFVNKSVSTINGGTYGSIYVWSQAHLTINDAEVATIDCSTITTRNLGMLTIGAGSHVKTIHLTTGGWTQYEPALTIEKGAVVDEIIYRGKSYSQKEWNNPFYGKYISIMGDSISTYTGWSDVNPITDESCVNRYGEAYYGPVGGDFHNTDMLVDDTWWYQAAQELGAEILMNNSGNSSGVLYASYPQNADWDLYLKEMLAWKSRPYYLKTEEHNPDIIALYIGSNEARNSNVIKDKGSLEDTLSKNLIEENADGTYTYTTPVTFTDAYFIMMHKVTVTYPEAEVYCFLPVPQAGGYLSTINTRMKSTIAVNTAISEVADYYGAIKVNLIEAFNVDPDGDGTVVQEDFDVFSTYFHNDPHPNASGFDVITNCFVETVLENSKYNK